MKSIFANMNENPSLRGDSSHVSLADEQSVRDVIVRSILSLWDVVNDLTRLRPSKQERYRVTIFGSARAVPGSVPYEETKRVASALADLGCDIITGGGPGLMRAANEGAVNAPERVHSLGIRVQLPFEQDANDFLTQTFQHRTFFTRLHQFVLTSDAYIVAPGGIGTVLETMMIWQLLQVKHLEKVPLILVGREWPGLVEWARSTMLSFDPPLATAEDFSIPVCVASTDEAIDLMRSHHADWQQAQDQKGKQ
ncbi:MAG: LOG family protein [Planctomycetaceae bacterium]|nr:LOG family protein [Planctomycetaceae bacterium]